MSEGYPMLDYSVLQLKCFIQPL